jgi:hypothetical protein
VVWVEVTYSPSLTGSSTTTSSSKFLETSYNSLNSATLSSLLDAEVTSVVVTSDPMATIASDSSLHFHVKGEGEIITQSLLCPLLLSLSSSSLSLSSSLELT